MHADWMSQLDRIARPVFENLAKGELRSQLKKRVGFNSNFDAAPLEAFGRSFCGISGFLGNKQLGATEILRQKYIELFIKGIENAIDPKSVDYMFFPNIGQILVDASFLAMGLIESFNEVWLKLSQPVKTKLITCLKKTRLIKPGYNNWLLFSAMIEVFLFKAGESDFDLMRIEFALSKHNEWYLGDGVYGDGPKFRFDYYNSFVIQPYLICILNEIGEHVKFNISFEDVCNRAKRYAEIQERQIMPDGKFPVVGRSMAYRLGAFQHLSYLSYKKMLPDKISEGQVRCALTAVKDQLFNQDQNFDSEGWLTAGFNGNQQEVLDSYISAGSPYLTLTGFWHLGLCEDDSFWKSEDKLWSSVLAWGGSKITSDKCLRD